MLDIQHDKLRERVNNAIVNIRLIASRVKRANVADAAQKCETVVSLLNEFRQYVVAMQYHNPIAGIDTAFKHNQDTLTRISMATFQADDIYHKLTKARQKIYEQEYRHIWNLLENIHTYLEKIIEKGATNA